MTEQQSGATRYVTVSRRKLRERIALTGLSDDDLYELLFSATTMDVCSLQHHLRRIVLECKE